MGQNPNLQGHPAQSLTKYGPTHTESSVLEHSLTDQLIFSHPELTIWPHQLANPSQASNPKCCTTLNLFNGLTYYTPSFAWS